MHAIKRQLPNRFLRIAFHPVVEHPRLAIRAQCAHQEELKHHRDKIWPTFERECFEPRVADAEVIPILLDDTAFPGIPKDTIGIKYAWKPEDPGWRDEVIDKIVYKLIDRAS